MQTKNIQNIDTTCVCILWVSPRISDITYTVGWVMQWLDTAIHQLHPYWADSIVFVCEHSSYPLICDLSTAQYYQLFEQVTRVRCIMYLPQPRPLISTKLKITLSSKIKGVSTVAKII